MMEEPDFLNFYTWYYTGGKKYIYFYGKPYKDQSTGLWYAEAMTIRDGTLEFNSSWTCVANDWSGAYETKIPADFRRLVLAGVMK